MPNFGITFPDTEITTDIIDNIRLSIGRLVSFFAPTLSGCSVCDLDPITNTSTDSFCPVCSGEHWVKTYTATTITGHVNWGPADKLNWQSGGQIFDGDVTIQIKAEDDTIALLDNTDYILVDGRKVEEKNRIPRGVPDINRYILNCIEKEKS